MFLENINDTNLLMLESHLKLDLTCKNYLLLKLYSYYIGIVNNKYKTPLRLERKLVDLYDTNFYTTVLTYKNNLLLRCEIQTIDFEKFNLEYKNEDIINLAFDYFYNPLIIKNNFVKKYFKKAKEDYLDDVRYIKENELIYSRALSDIYYKKNYVSDIELLLDEEYIKSISELDLYNFYINNIKDNDSIRYYTNIKTNNNLINKVYRNEIFKEVCFDETLKEVRLEANCNEVLLEYYVKLDADLYNSNIYNFCLGGNSNSKLFRKVRTQNQLAYLVSSSYDSKNEFIRITVSTSKDNLVKVKELINEAINETISIEEFEFAKKKYVNSHLEARDNNVTVFKRAVMVNYMNSDSLDLATTIYQNLDYEEFKKSLNNIRTILIFERGNFNENL